jgi:tripartite-type tricarboxylate transporter receptor subunit TctC
MEGEGNMTRYLLAGALAVLLGTSFSASAQTWPDKPIKLIVPFAAGGGTDLAARLAAKYIGARLGQSVFVENRGGANGIVGLQALKQAAPDGYTIAMASDGPLVINHGLYKEKLPYDSLKDWAPIHMFNKFVGLIVVHPSVPAKTIKELIAYAKANPGKLNYSSAGIGNFSHLGVELFMQATGTKFVHVPFTGVGPGTQALIAGDVQLMFNNVATALQGIEAGQLRGLGIGEPKSLPELPKLPAIADDVPGYEMAAWTGIIGPAGLPRPIVERLAKETAAALDEPEVKSFFAKQYMVAIRKGPDEFAATLRSDLAKWNKIIETAGIRIAQ